MIGEITAYSISSAVYGLLHIDVGLQTGSTVKFHVSHCRKIPTLSPSRQSVILKALKITNYKIDGGVTWDTM